MVLDAIVCKQTNVGLNVASNVININIIGHVLHSGVDGRSKGEEKGLKKIRCMAYIRSGAVFRHIIRNV